VQKNNDTYGHQVGDMVLKELARFFTSRLRQADTVARYGGEEFAILLPHATYEGAATLAERLRKQVLDINFAESDGRVVKISISVGISAYPEDPIDQKDTMIFYADKALYKAKSSGRNRVCLYQTLIKEFSNKLPTIQIKDTQVVELRKRLMDISEMAKRAYIEATEALVHAIEAKDESTLGHASRVSRMCAEVGRSMGFSQDDVSVFQHAGLLHDIGKICIQDEILRKPGSFDNKEYESMKAHAVLGFQIVKPIKFLSEEAAIILHHHERYDGQGYPHHLKGKEIPVGARIAAVADAYDTMRVAGSSYKKTMTLHEAVSELITNAGIQFDAEVVYHFVQTLLQKGEFELQASENEKLQEALKSSAA